jgi:hypothetical protein
VLLKSRQPSTSSFPAVPAQKAWRQPAWARRRALCAVRLPAVTHHMQSWIKNQNGRQGRREANFRMQC